VNLLCHMASRRFLNDLLLEIFNITQSWEVVQLIRSWVYSLMVTSSSPLKATYPRQSLVSIVEHVLIGCCVSPLGLVKVCVSTKRWPGHPRLSNKKKKNHSYVHIKCTYMKLIYTWEKCCIYIILGNWMVKQY
jgi:hypothetical protein